MARSFDLSPHGTEQDKTHSSGPARRFDASHHDTDHNDFFLMRPHHPEVAAWLEENAVSLPVKPITRDLNKEAQEAAKARSHSAAKLNSDCATGYSAR